MENNELLVIGKIVGVHGINGNCKAVFYLESFSVINPGSLIYLKTPEGKKDKCEIKWVKPHGRGVLLALKHIRSRNDAELLIGCELLMEKAGLPELESGVYYWCDLIGMTVIDADNQSIGRIESIIETGSNDVYVVRNNDKETLIPAIPSVVKTIDLTEKVVHVELPEGL